MPRKLIIETTRCEKCKGTGRVPSRLPFRDKPCEWCGGKGIKEPKPTIARIGKPRAGVNVTTPAISLALAYGPVRQPCSNCGSILLGARPLARSPDKRAQLMYIATPITR